MVQQHHFDRRQLLGILTASQFQPKIIESMDMIITVDTCILHLAGAMNKECWGVMSYYADWRWGTEEKPIWYDSIRLFRQENPKDWATVFKKIKTELIGKLNVRKKALDAAAT